MSDIISKSLGLPIANTAPEQKQEVTAPVVAEEPETAVAVVDPDAEEKENDFKFARTNLYSILTKGEAALEELTDIARQSQHPRAYEVLASTIKTLSDVNDRLLGLQRDKIKLKKENEEGTADAGKGVVNYIDKAVFTGTSTDLLKQVKPKK